MLAKWEALSDRAEVFELLSLAGLPNDCFAPHQWSSAPLKRLKNSAPPPAAAHLTDLTPGPATWTLIINQVQVLADRVRQLEYVLEANNYQGSMALAAAVATAS